MKTKIFSIIPLSLILISCSANISQDTTFYEKYSIEELWKTSLETIQGMKFVVKNIEKESGYIFAEFESGTLFTRTSEPNPQLIVYISKSNGKTKIMCQCVRCNYVHELGWNTGREIVNFFLTKLNENLKKGNAP